MDCLNNMKDLTMPMISRDSLWSLETYAKKRPEFRKEVIAHKKLRTVHLGNHVTLLFEDEMTIRYQIQEMLRIERIFEEDGIAHELEAYNPLVPTGSNFKCTMLIEYSEAADRTEALKRLRGLEKRIYVQVEGSERVFAIADEDLERENDEKTSAVHFMRFELNEDMIKALKYGVSLAIGVDHAHYRVEVNPLADATRASLVSDLA
jgi:hypothetical protein